MQPGTTHRRAGTADLCQRTVRMAARPRLAPTTLIRVCTVQLARARTLTAIGAVQSRYAETSGRRPRIEQPRKERQPAFEPPKEREVSGSVERTGIAASSPRAKTTTCTPARMEMSTARTPAVHGRSTRMAAGQIQAPSPLLMPKVNSVLLRELPTERVLRNGQQLLRGQFNNSTVTLRRARLPVTRARFPPR